MIQAVYGSESMNWKNIFKWYAKFRDSRDCTEDDLRPEPSLTVRFEGNVQKVAIGILNRL